MVPVKDDKKEQQLMKYLVELFSRASTDKETEKLVKEIEALIADNKWIQHFNNINIAQGWIDFEGEIAKIIRALDDVRVKSIKGIRTTGKWEKLTPYEQQILSPFWGQVSFLTSLESLDKLKERLLDDLNRLIRCLEIYLCDYVENLPIKKKLPDIADLDIHAVVSFNYTNTYRANYVADSSNKVECDFIHGEAKLENIYFRMKLLIKSVQENAENYLKIKILFHLK